MCMSLEAISVAFLFPRGGEQCRKRYAPMVQDKRLACSMCGSVADGAQLLRMVNCPHHEDFGCCLGVHIFLLTGDTGKI